MFPNLSGSPMDLGNLVKQHHPGPGLLAATYVALCVVPFGAGKSTTLGAGACPAAPCTTQTAASANGKNRLFVSVFLAEYRKSSPKCAGCEPTEADP
jgi:hypothetical protein